jgi:hypothetical protein
MYIIVSHTHMIGAALTAIEYVIVASKILICHIDQNKVAAELGVNADKDDPTAVLGRKESETRKAGLVEVQIIRLIRHIYTFLKYMYICYIYIQIYVYI